MEHRDHRRGPRDGRVFRQVRRSLIVAGGNSVRFVDLTAWAYAGHRRPWRWPIYRALKRYGTNVGRGMWAPNDELLARIGGAKKPGL